MEAQPDSKVIAEAEAYMECDPAFICPSTVRHITALIALCRSQAEERGDIAVMKAQYEALLINRDTEIADLKAKLADSQAREAGLVAALEKVRDRYKTVPDSFTFKHCTQALTDQGEVTDETH